MHITHLSAECFPIAKVGGLADVVGSLPKYLNGQGVLCDVVLPMYHNDRTGAYEFETVHEGKFLLGGISTGYAVKKLTGTDFGFPFYMIDIPGRFDRPGIYTDPRSGYAYWDEFERAASFQIAALEWMLNRGQKPDIIHCHDHHTGLTPFLLSNCRRYRTLAHTPTVFTVHNAEYHGQYPRDYYKMLPAFDLRNAGLLDWDGSINALAAALKCAWFVTTVSENYLEELKRHSHGLEVLFSSEDAKSKGILNGIDTEVWNPAADSLIKFNYSYRNRRQGKLENKKALAAHFNINPEWPVIAFIGRLVREKGADLLPDLYREIRKSDKKVNFILLGTGERELEQRFAAMKKELPGFFDASLQYNEALAHQIYAGADFIFMPSRVEPCGLNQMFAMRYGTIPIVRTAGGLKDTVKDIAEEGGYGIRFDNFNIPDAQNAILRALELYNNKSLLSKSISQVMKLDFSWNRSAQEYVSIYKTLMKKAGR